MENREVIEDRDKDSGGFQDQQCWRKKDCNETGRRILVCSCGNFYYCYFQGRSKCSFSFLQRQYLSLSPNTTVNSLTIILSSLKTDIRWKKAPHSSIGAQFFSCAPMARGNNSRKTSSCENGWSSLLSMSKAAGSALTQRAGNCVQLHVVFKKASKERKRESARRQRTNAITRKNTC